MRAVVVVVGTPGLEHSAGVQERAEQGLVEQFVAQPTDEPLGEGVLRRFARRDVVPFDLVLVRPSQDGVAGELGTVVADNGLGLAPRGEKPIELTGDPDPRDRGIRNEGQAFARAIIDHHEDAVPAQKSEALERPRDFPGTTIPLWA